MGLKAASVLKDYRVAYIVHEFLSSWIVDKQELIIEFSYSTKTATSDLKSAKEILADLYGGIVNYNRSDDLYELTNHEEVIKKLIKP